jgi:hypothetical protein
MKRMKVSLGPEPITVGVWMALARAIDAWARLQNARAVEIELMNRASANEAAS